MKGKQIKNLDVLYDLDAEQSLLGSIMIAENRNDMILDEISEIIKPKDFYRAAHREIYSAMLELARNNIGIDNITLQDKLTKTGKLEKVGGISYITNLANTVPSYRNAKYYAGIVREKAIKRKLIYTCDNIKDDCYGDTDAEHILEKAQSDILSIMDKNNGLSNILEPKYYITEAFAEIEKRSNGEIYGADTGIKKLNDATGGGLQKGDLIILGARPSMGKTALALSLALYIAERGTPAAVFSLEMPCSQLVYRLFASKACINLKKIKTVISDGAEWEKLIKAGNELSRLNLYIDDTAGMTIEQIRTKARKFVREKNIKVLFIDYLQLISSSGGKKENRVQEITEISRALKILARELDITIVALSQLSRKTEERQDKRPMLSDLRDSGSIEQDADIVMFLYREAYYKENAEDKNKTELIIAKNRNGETGTIKLEFKPQYCLFTEYKPTEAEIFEQQAGQDMGKVPKKKVDKAFPAQVPPIQEELTAKQA